MERWNDGLKALLHRTIRLVQLQPKFQKLWTIYRSNTMKLKKVGGGRAKRCKRAHPNFSCVAFGRKSWFAMLPMQDKVVPKRQVAPSYRYYTNSPTAKRISE